jgi:hypothetical protein
MRTHLRAHRACIDCLMRRGWRDGMLGINRGRICVSGHAFVLWRISWETARTPHQLISRRRGYALDAAAYWSPRSSDLPTLALYRIFALECLAVFQECMLLAERFHRKHMLSFNTSFVKRRRLPYWVVRIRDDGSTVTHWWLRRSVGQVVPVASIARLPDKKPCSFKPSKWSGFC